MAAAAEGVQSLGEGAEGGLLRQAEEAAAERLGRGLLQHVSSELVLESDLRSIVDRERHS